VNSARGAKNPKSRAVKVSPLGPYVLLLYVQMQIQSLQSLASHPLPKILGLEADSSGALQTLATFWLHVDFTLDAGVEVWRAGNTKDAL